MELSMVFLAGVLGSSHCIGMCGPFALTIGSSTRGWSASLGRQLVYSCGRIFTYTVLGATAGFAGLSLTNSLPSLLNVPAMLSLVAGVLLLWQGLAAAGVLRRPLSAARGPCLAHTLFASFLTSGAARDTFLAGLFTGLLPCGLVYSFVALAASSANMASGAVTLALFGLGTVPVMVLTGCGASLIGGRARRGMYRFAAWCVVLAGCLSLARGVAALQISGSTDVPPLDCPLCVEYE